MVCLIEAKELRYSLYGFHPEAAHLSTDRLLSSIARHLQSALTEHTRVAKGAADQLTVCRAMPLFSIDSLAALPGNVDCMSDGEDGSF